MHRSLRLVSVTAGMLLGCSVYDPRMIEPSGSGGGAGTMAMTMDGGTKRDSGPAASDAGDGGDSAMCVPTGDEACNLADDDCDGKTDEDTVDVCAQVIVNGRAECVHIEGEARCVLRKCFDGYSNCDGDPTNGCEPYCMCHDCPLDDAGEPVFVGDDAGLQ